MEKERDHTRRLWLAEGKLRRGRSHDLCMGGNLAHGREAGFTLIELLVVVGIISVVTAVSLPVLGRARRSMRTTLDVVHTRQTTSAEIQYALDHGDKFAPSVATIWSPGSGSVDSYEPYVLVNMFYASLKPREHANQSGYLGEYLGKAEYVHCPESGRTPEWLDDAWAAGDAWHRGWFTMGTKCFWRNFTGILGDGRVVEGPKTVCERGAAERVLVSCVLNYGRGGQARLISSGYFNGSTLDVPSRAKNNYLWPEYWIGEVGENELDGAMEGVWIQAGYVDGHAKSSKACDTMGVWVAADRGLASMPRLSHGKNFLPQRGLR